LKVVTHEAVGNFALLRKPAIPLKEAADHLRRRTCELLGRQAGLRLKVFAVLRRMNEEVHVKRQYLHCVHLPYPESKILRSVPFPNP
jgi:hypothetical protein